MQALHLKCLLCQTNKLMCCHFKPNPVPATNNITHADIISISHLHLLSVYYQDLNRDNRYLSHAALHLKCLLCQTNKLMRSHFKPNPVPATNNITHADIISISISHLHLLSVYYQDLNRDNRYLSHALSTLICPHCSFVLYIIIHTIYTI